VDAAVVATAPSKPRPAVRPPPPETETEAPAEDEGTAKQFLDKAAGALQAGDAKEAIRLARRSLNERTTVRAYSIIARAYCALGDLGNVRAQLAQLPPREKRRVFRVCQKAGVDLTP